MNKYTKNRWVWLGAIGGLFIYGGCGKLVSSPQTAPEAQAPASSLQSGSVVVKSRAVLAINAGTASRSIQSPLRSGSPEQAISVSNGPSSAWMIGTQDWSIPSITNAIVDFGSLRISEFTDNDLNVCGDKGKQHCNQAMIRVYTLDADGAGLWNTEDEYGAPLLVGQNESAMLPVGLSAGNATVIQSVAIPKNKHVVRLEDLIPEPNYLFKADFTDAGAGDYSTTLVIEYVLSL